LFLSIGNLIWQVRAARIGSLPCFGSGLDVWHGNVPRRELHTLHLGAIAGNRDIDEGRKYLLYDAECHVFKGIIKSTNTTVWQYFYTDREGLNQHSEYFDTKRAAMEGYINRAGDRRGTERLFL
jgi:hypothetical protein